MSKIDIWTPRHAQNVRNKENIMNPSPPAMLGSKKPSLKPRVYVPLALNLPLLSPQSTPRLPDELNLSRMESGFGIPCVYIKVAPAQEPIPSPTYGFNVPLSIR
jgi:hypothetical protein